MTCVSEVPETDITMLSTTLLTVVIHCAGVMKPVSSLLCSNSATKCAALVNCSTTAAQYMTRSRDNASVYSVTHRFDCDDAGLGQH
eukprot:20054-Heterococcus_DN1.PRE.1